MIAATVALVVSIVGGTVAIENRYTLQSDFTNQVVASDRYHLEQEIRRAQDRLNELLNHPDRGRAEWIAREIQRLQNVIDRLERQLSRG